MPPLPWLPGVARAILVNDAGFTAVLSAARLAFKAPSDVTSKFGLIQIPGNNSIDGGGVAFSPLVQVDGFCPMSDGNSEALAWDIAAAAAVVFGRARNVTVGSATYSGRLLDGPMAAPTDVSRGTSNPLARALMRAELTLHNR